MKIILLGCPGVGKGSQATLIKDYYAIPHISTGDAFRRNIAAGTELGVYAKSFIDKGLLVPDDVTIGIVRERLKEEDCKNGFLLDGFPRTVAQADALAGFAAVDTVINMTIDPIVVAVRLSGRRVCRCGETYHVSRYTSSDCAKCGQPLFIRDDDKQDTVVKRLEVYYAQTAPLIDYYRAKGLLIDVDGSGTVEEVFERVKKVL